MLTAAGATPWPQIISARRVFWFQTRIGTSPSGPFRCGSTTCKVKPAATAASKALPPFSRTLIATEEASQWVVATTPKVPRISGRVVKPGIVSSILLRATADWRANLLQLSQAKKDGQRPVHCAQCRVVGAADDRPYPFAARRLRLIDLDLRGTIQS